MSTYRGYEGVWAVWDYGGAGDGPRVSKIYTDVTDAARDCQMY
jgi:hypothetical protein